MDPLQRLKEAWVRAGYPKEYIPKQQFEKAAPHVAEAFAEGVADFIREGWRRAEVDFPFVEGHPRYEKMKEAYRTLAQPT